MDKTFTNEPKETQDRRWIEYGVEKTFDRDTGAITAKEIKTFTNNNLYIEKKKSRKALISENVNLNDIAKVKKKISPYASKALFSNEYDEVYTEYRVSKLLSKKEK